jgi:adenine deaminase
VVVSNGQGIARGGDLLAAPRQHEYTTPSLNSIHLAQNKEPADFNIVVNEDTDTVKIRLIELVTDLVTAELEAQWPVTGGQLKPDLDQNVVKVAAVDRTHNPGKIFCGLIKGFGLKSGAMACSAAWDTTDIIVVGANDADMAVAVNRIHSLQGGAVVCEKGDIIAELSLPVFGIMSDLPIEDIARELEKIKTAATDLGVRHPDPLLTLITLTGAAIPYLRICEEGLVNLKDGKTLPLFAT